MLQYYGPFKCYYNKAIANWMINNPGNTITFYNIASVVKESHNNAMTPCNTHSASKKIDIFSFNRDIFSEDDFLMNSVTDRTEVSNENLNLEKLHQNLNVSLSNVQTDLEPIELSTELPTSSQSITPICHKTQQTAVFISAEEIRGLPKAGDRKSNKKNRVKQKFITTTDAPEKNKIAEKNSIRKSSVSVKRKLHTSQKKLIDPSTNKKNK